jgi:hypothetical protein
VYLAFTAAEERRLLGAHALYQHIGERVGLAVSLDLVGSPGELTLNGLSNGLGAAWLAWLDGVGDKAGVSLTAPVFHRVISRLFPQLERSDHGVFTREGVPAFHIYHRGDHRRGDDPVFLAYHTEFDTADRVDEQAVAAAARFVFTLSRVGGELPAIGGDRGTWVPLPGGSAVVAAARAVYVAEGFLAVLALFTLIRIAGTRDQRPREDGRGALAILVAWASGVALAAAAGFLAAALRDHPLPWAHAPGRHIAGLVACGLGGCLLAIALLGGGKPIAGRGRHAVVAISVQLLVGLALLLFRLHELAWCFLLPAGAWSMAWRARSSAVAVVSVGVGALPVAVVLAPSLYREASFHGFYPASVPLAVFVGAWLFPHLFALTFLRKRLAFAAMSRRSLVLAGAVAALVGVLTLAVPEPPCTGELFEQRGLACELLARP